MADLTIERERRLVGCLLGHAVGDALGLPYEGLSPRRARRLWGDAVRHRLAFGRGLISDDTEHAAMTGQAVLASGGDPRRFARSLAWRLRFWLLGSPAGCGLATGRAIVKLWLGIPASRSGVFSAGNGPVMRAPILGVVFAADGDRRKAFVEASTRLTHTDPRADAGAQLVARAAASIAPGFHPTEWLRSEAAAAGDTELGAHLRAGAEQLARGAEVRDFARAIGLAAGVSGYVNHTVPVALYAWLRHREDFRACVESVVRLGGDTDTVAGVAGALAGADAGPEAIPGEWIDGILDWPRSTTWLRRLAVRLAAIPFCGPQPLFWPALLLRNPIFLSIVLAHGLRRLLPPY